MQVDILRSQTASYHDISQSVRSKNDNETLFRQNSSTLVADAKADTMIGDTNGVMKGAMKGVRIGETITMTDSATTGTILNDLG